MIICKAVHGIFPNLLKELLIIQAYKGINCRGEIASVSCSRFKVTLLAVAYTFLVNKSDEVTSN